MNIKVIDNFLPDFEAVKAQAMAQDFEPKEYDGYPYEGIALDVQVDSELLGDVAPRFAFWRIAKEGDPTPTPIHCDNSCDSMAGLLYMTDPVGDLDGTAFWRHRETDTHALPSHPRALTNHVLAAARRDAADLSAWDMTMLVKAKANRFVTYPSHYWHSRYPIDCTGYTAQDPRLIWVVFYS